MRCFCMASLFASTNTIGRLVTVLIKARCNGGVDQLRDRRTNVALLEHKFIGQFDVITAQILPGVRIGDTNVQKAVM